MKTVGNKHIAIYVKQNGVVVSSAPSLDCVADEYVFESFERLTEYLRELITGELSDDR